MRTHSLRNKVWFDQNTNKTFQLKESLRVWGGSGGWCEKGCSRGLIPAMDDCGTVVFCVAITTFRQSFWLAADQCRSQLTREASRVFPNMPGIAQHKLLFPHLTPKRSTVGVFGNNENTWGKKGFLGKETGRNEKEDPETASLSPKGQREIRRC